MGKLVELDIALFRLINGITHPLLDPVMHFLSFLLEGGWIFWAVCILLPFIDRRKGKKAALYTFIGITFTDQVLGHLVKFLWNRPRPFLYMEGIKVIGHRWGYSSFPSGHADAVFAWTVVLSFFYPKLKWSLYIYSILICISRVYCGIHHPLDVIAGAFVGMLGGWVMLNLHQKFGEELGWLCPLFVLTLVTVLSREFLHLNQPISMCIGVLLGSLTYLFVFRYYQSKHKNHVDRESHESCQIANGQ